MNDADSLHLTAEELDALHDGAGSARVTSHLETCTDCQALVELDRRLVGSLSALPAFDPSPDFEDLVMARVAIAPAASTVAVATPSPRSIAARRRAMVGSLLGGISLVASFVWAAANPTAALGGFEPTLRRGAVSFWLSLQSLADNAVLVASPGKMLLAMVALSGLYVVALTGFRFLLTEPVADAH